jgi:uncharacterized protein DUF1236
MRAHSILTTAAAVLLASTVFAAAQGTQKQGPGAEGSPSQGQVQREGQQGKQAPQKGDRGENSNQKGSSQAQEREGPKGKEQVQQGQKEQQGKQQGQKERTEGQGGGRAETQKGAEPKGKAGEHTEGQGQRERTEGQKGTEGQRGERSQGSTSVTLTQEQKTRVRETVLQGGSAPRVNNVNFQVRVGTVVPTSVRVVEVAPVLIEVHPEWRGFFYFIVNDQIIIVDRNHHIVAVLDV